MGVARAHAPAHHGDEHRAHGRAHASSQRPQRLPDAVGGDLRRAEGGDQGAQHHLGQLEQYLLGGVGHGDAQYAPGPCYVISFLMGYEHDIGVDDIFYENRKDAVEYQIIMIKEQ